MIEEETVTDKIPNHRGIWEVRAKPLGSSNISRFIQKGSFGLHAVDHHSFWMIDVLKIFQLEHLEQKLVLEG